MEYDHAGRLLHTNLYINNNDPVCISMNNYNELGELSAKNLHSVNQTTFLQSVNYNYNIRGWLTQINDPEDLSPDNDCFGMNLFYEEPDAGLNISGQYNGNISGSPGGTGMMIPSGPMDTVTMPLTGSFQQIIKEHYPETGQIMINMMLEILLMI
jgi:hypothetical protein